MITRATADSGTATRTPVSSSVMGIALAASLGVLLAAGAFAMGRAMDGEPLVAVVTYWLGQLLIVVPIAVRLLSLRHRTPSETGALLVVFTIAEYVVKVCYSPVAFAFPDELQHLRTVEDILATQELFTTNYALPVSPSYPGLENATAALVSLTGLPVVVGGLLVAGIAHLTFVYVLYLLFTHVTGSFRTAGIGTLIYAANSHFQFFDSMFAYGTMALTFLGVVLLSVARLSVSDSRQQTVIWGATGALAAAVTVVTHHVTSLALVALLVLLWIVSTIAGGRRLARVAAGAALTTAALGAGWTLLVAPETLGYLQPVVASVTSFELNPFSGDGAAAGTPAIPLANLVLAGVSTLLLGLILPYGWLHIARRHRDSSWLLAMAVGSVAWYALLLVRFAAPDGAELAGRASTYVYVPAACVAGVAIAHLLERFGSRLAPELVAAAAATVLVMNSLANGLPPHWERLPGGFQAGGLERSVSPQGVAAARWANDVFGPGNRFAADRTNYTLLGTYGRQEAVRDGGPLYRSSTIRPSDVSLIRDSSVQYLLTDERLTTSQPVSGQYFAVDERAGEYRRPLPLAGLRKYDDAPRASRVYDGGAIKVYDVRGVRSE